MKRIIFAILIMVAAVMAVTIYFKFDPAVSNSLFPKCFFYTLTGYQCPGCGTQRAIHSILHGDVAAAMHYNGALLVAVPVILLYAVAEFFRKNRPEFYVSLHSPVAIIAIVIAIVAWWILRNIFLPL